MELTAEQQARFVTALDNLRDAISRFDEAVQAGLVASFPPASTTAYAVGKAGDAVRLTLEVNGCDVTLRVQHTDEELRGNGELHSTGNVQLRSVGCPELYRQGVEWVEVFVRGDETECDDDTDTTIFSTPAAARQACLDIIACVEEFNAKRKGKQ